MPECLKRLFVGIFPPADSLDAILDAERKWRLPNAKWVVAERRHLTLCFLGSVPESRVLQVIESLRQIEPRSGLLRFELVGLGTFPNLRRPQVLWVGIDGDSFALSQLAEDVQRACTPWMEKPEARPYRPHLTIARIRKPNPELRSLLEREGSNRWGKFESSEFQLIESRPNEPGSPYIALESFPISKPDS